MEPKLYVSWQILITYTSLNSLFQAFSKHLSMELQIRDLSMNEYFAIQQIKSENPKTSFEKLKTRIFEKCPHLAFFSIAQIKEMFERSRDAPYNLFNDIRELFKLEKHINDFIQFLENPCSFLYNNVFPFFKSKCNQNWTDNENQRLICLTQNYKGKFNFGLLGMLFPGRTGKQIRTHYSDLISKGTIEEQECFLEDERFEDETKKIFIENTEKQIVDAICDCVKDGIQVSKDFVIKKATEIFYEPRNLAKRIAFQTFVRDKKKIYETNDELTYTNEFIEFARQIQEINEELNEIKVALSEKQIEPEEKISSGVEILKRYGMKKPAFSNFWISTFMKRDRLSWRRAHYARRSSIDLAYADIYLNLVAEAICKYVYDHVYNMDETSVRINNGSIRTIAPVGLDVIQIDSKRDEKENFTCIGTCTRNEVKELIILSKGGNKSSLKFNVHENAQVWPTKNINGWVNE